MDEIHLDFIRYPYRTFGYHPKVMKEYRKWVRKMMRQGKRPKNGFDDYRRSAVTETVRMIHDAVSKYGKKLSAAVYAYYDDAYNNLFQAWLDWIKTGILDYAAMMAYESSIETVKSYLDFVKKELGSLRKIRVGLGLYKLTDKPEVLRDMLEMVEGYNPDEIVFFSYRYIKGDIKAVISGFSE